MDTVLLVIGFLGLGALIIAAYVFIRATSKYASHRGQLGAENSATTDFYIERSHNDRRLLIQLDFPMTVGELLLPGERRTLTERRMATA